ncbi:MAG: SGNH/GDSL hydrolase family protein [Acidobacteriota bacterium]
MKTILCYGDSNTWGYAPVSKERYAPEVRWPGVLKRSLGADFHVIEEGLNGRTTVLDDAIEPYRNGKEYLIPCLISHKPLDLVIILLGTNDLKRRFSLPPSDIARGAGQLVELVLKSDTGPNGKAPRVLLISPAPLAKLTELAEMFEGAEEKSFKLGRHYREIATQLGCPFLDAGEIVKSSDRDGIHLEAEAHEKLGKAIASRVTEILA